VKNYQHIIRLGIVMAVGGTVLLVVRASLVPATFGQYGSYVGASVEVIRNRPIRYVGSERCKDCHKKEWGKWSRKEHQTVACEVCHGPSSRHSVEEVEVRPLPLRCKSNGRMLEQGHDLCMSCHAEVQGRATDVSQINAQQHLAEFKITEQSEDFEESMRCLTCHNGHSPIK
jgi:hypothetical protein